MNNKIILKDTRRIVLKELSAGQEYYLDAPGMRIEEGKILLFAGIQPADGSLPDSKWMWDRVTIEIHKSHPFFLFFLEIKNEFCRVMESYYWSCYIRLSLDPELWKWWLDCYNWNVLDDKSHKFNVLNRLSRKENDVFYIIDYVWQEAVNKKTFRELIHGESTLDRDTSYSS